MLVVVASCSTGPHRGSGSAPASSPLDSARRRTAAACVLVLAPEASALFGRPAREVAVSQAGHAESVCGYSANTTSDTTAFDNITYSLIVYVYDDTTQYEQPIAGAATPIAGIGERALRISRSDLVAIEFVKNGQTVLISYSITALTHHPTPNTNAAQLVGLARMAANRV